MQVLQDQPRSGRPIEVDGQQRDKITALACSQPPEGYAQWSLHLLADKAIELGYVEGISHTEVRKIFKKTIKTASEAHRLALGAQPSHVTSKIGRLNFRNTPISNVFQLMVEHVFVGGNCALA